jgi:hypothetical protein
VVLRPNYIATPRHKQLPIRLINPREESRYQTVLEQRPVGASAAATPEEYR